MREFAMEEAPFVSVVMPIRNEDSYIYKSLSAVVSQDYPPDRMEVIIADGMSTDNTRKIVQAFQARYPTVRLVDNPGRIVSTGLNAGMAQARGQILIRVDGHTVIARDYVRECVSALRRSGADNVGGRMDAIGDGWFGRAVALATSSRFGVGGARFHCSEVEEWVDTVYMGAWPRNVFRRVGLFDPEQVRNQDDEFNYRLRSQGGKIFLSPRIKSKYHNRSTLLSLWSQYFRYGYWKVRVMQKHPKQMRLRQFIPPLFVATLCVTSLMAPFSIISWWIFGSVIATYVVSNVLASSVLAQREELRLLPLLSLAFATLHLSYGFGFLFGLVRFWNRWGQSQNRLGQSGAPVPDVEQI